MATDSFTIFYPYPAQVERNLSGRLALEQRVGLEPCQKSFMVAKPSVPFGSDEIPGRFSSSLPPLFASGRFAAFLSRVS